MHALTAGLTQEFCGEELLRLLMQWSPRTDWHVAYVAGYWHAANEERELMHVRYYEDAVYRWRVQCENKWEVVG